MAFKFYHRFSAAEFQRYRDFFPKIEPGTSWGSVARTSTTFTAASRSDTIVARCKTADNKTCDESTPQNELGGQRWKVIPTPPNSYDEDDILPSTITCPTSSTVSTSSSTTPSISSTGLSDTSSSRSRRRKTSIPRRGPKRNDPKFKGVTSLMETAILHGEREAKLKIKSKLSIRRYRRMLASRSMTRWRRILHRRFCFHGNSLTKDNPLSDSSSTDTDTEFGKMKTHAFKSVSNKKRMWPRLFVSSVSHLRNTTTKLGRHCGRLSTHTIPDPLKSQGKTCESCKTTRTPLWRDAEDGTPLCNACGIRYKKYRIRCPFCWLVPRKDSKTFPYCGRCGMLLKLTLQRRIHYL